MCKKSIVAIVAIGFFAFLSPMANAQSKLEITKKRVSKSPTGDSQLEDKFIPGDTLFVSVDLIGLTPDPKISDFSYECQLQLFHRDDDKPAKLLLNAKTDHTRIPAELKMLLAGNLRPGNYVVRLIISDKRNKDNFRYFDHSFKLLPKE